MGVPRLHGTRRCRQYRRRRSAWEAPARLGAARDELWKLLAVALGARDPQFGLTSIVDFAAGPLRAAMQATVAELDLAAFTPTPGPGTS